MEQSQVIGAEDEPSALALTIFNSPRFVASDFTQEKLSLYNAIETEAATFVEEAAFNLNASNDLYWQAAGKFEKVLLVRIVDYLLDALRLLGVADAGAQAEVCRCVIKGGTFLDDKGFGLSRHLIE